MRDLASKIAPVVVFGPVSLSADNTPANIDLKDFDSAVLLLGIGIGGITFDATNKIEFVFSHADDDGTGAPGAYTPVTAADINGKDAPASVTNGIIKALTAAHAAAAQYEFGYIGGKRFVRLLADFSGTHGAGTPLSAVVVKGDPRVAPTN